jgi:hypothetical protein
MLSGVGDSLKSLCFDLDMGIEIANSPVDGGWLG